MEGQYDEYESIRNFQTYKNESPLVQYAEKYTALNVVGQITNKEVMDLACGYGFYSTLFAEHGAKSVLGVDVSPTMIKAANSLKEKKPVKNLEYLQGDATDLDLGRTFDVIFSTYLLNHAETPDILDKMCQNIFDHLKPGGKSVTIMTNGLEGIPYTCFQLRNYGVKYVIPATGLLDGQTYTTQFLDKNESVLFFVDDTHYNNSTIERGFRKAGFSSVQFRHFMISQEGYKKHGMDYWQPFIDQCPEIVIVAKKQECSDSRVLCFGA